MLEGGPVRTFGLLLACLIGWWALRWRERPDMLIWAFALALALRCYSESVMTDYYVWPALAVALVVAARCTDLQYGLAIVATVVTTITAQWHYSWLPWWLLDIGGMTVVVAAAARPELLPAANVDGSRLTDRPPARPTDLRTDKRALAAQAQRKAQDAQRKRNKAARAARSRARRA